MTTPVEKFELYSFDYKYKGSLWSADIYATSREDAKARLNSLQKDTEIIGPSILIPAD